MNIGKRLRSLREEKKMSQGDIEKCAGMLRCYTSRVENGHTVPSLATLEKYAKAFEIPLYKLFYEGEAPPELPHLSRRNAIEVLIEASPRKDARFMTRLLRYTSRMDEKKRKTWLSVAQKMAAQ